MVAAVGVGHVVAARGVAQPHVQSILREFIYCTRTCKSLILYRITVAMNATWAILAFLTCAAVLFHPGQGKGLEELGSATLLMTALNHFLFSTALWWMGKDVRKARSNVRTTIGKGKDR